MFDIVASLRCVPLVTRQFPVNSLDHLVLNYLVSLLVNTTIWTRAFAVGATTPWNMLPSNVKSVDNIAKIRRHLTTYFYNLAYPPQFPGVSSNLVTNGFVY